MKKKVGELFGMPIVVGNEHEVTHNEYYLTKDCGTIKISKRGSDGKLHSVTSTDDSAVTAMVLDDVTSNTNLGILDA